jgi:hypothetical protein
MLSIYIRSKALNLEGMEPWATALSQCPIAPAHISILRSFISSISATHLNGYMNEIYYGHEVYQAPDADSGSQQKLTSDVLI